MAHSQQSLTHDQLIRSAGIAIAGITLCASGAYLYAKERKDLLQTIGGIIKSASAFGLGIALIGLSSYLIRDLDILLVSGVKK